MDDNKLSKQDQQRVDEYLRSGYNQTPRQPFKPIKLLLVLLIIVGLMSVASVLIARLNGIV